MSRRTPSLAALFALVLPQMLPAQAQVASKLVAGGPNDFMEVRHLRIAGSNLEIGRHLAKLASEKYGFAAFRSGDPLRARAQRLYLKRNYPIFLERMRGVAAALGKDLEDDRLLFSSLFYNAPAPGCSVVFYPPSVTAAKQGVLSRYYDFSTGTLRGQRPPAGQLPATARPWLLELHPREGYASLAMVSYDLLGVIDGMNSEGLCVALLADGELMELGTEPNSATTSGLGVLQVGRMLLDTCKDVDEAKVALLANKHYYRSIPCHYIVCDAKGRSFVWEHSHQRNREFVIDGGGKPQITTNFMLHRHGGEKPARFGRYRALAKRIAGAEDLTLDAIKTAHRCAAASAGRATAEQPRGRTLWHAVYEPERRRVHLDFYLGDGKDGIRRSGYATFPLH